MTSSAASIQAATDRLAAVGIEEPLREARILARAAADDVTFAAYVARREKHEPVAYILGRKEFWSLEFEVSPAVLIPRPDSETLIETALKEFGREGPRRILDLGTGSGCLVIALLSEWHHATAVGVDISAEALAVARRNATRHDVASRLEFREGDWTNEIRERFDLVISNPPYISDAAFAALDPDVREHEPATALKAGPEGLSAIGRIACDLGVVLKPNGVTLIEIGHDQGQQAKEILTKSGLEPSRIVKDMAGHDRVVVARLPQ